MRVVSLSLKEFKGLDVRLDWPSAIVLFGPNDSGKTNILEAIEFLFTGAASGRVDRFRQHEDPYPPEAEMIFELDALGLPGSGDQELLVAWLAELLPHWEAGPVLDELRRLVGAVPEAEDRASAIDAVVRHFRELGREIVESLALHAGTGVDGGDAAALGDAAAASIRFFMSFDETMWLARAREELQPEARAALERIEVAADGEWEYPDQLLPLANEGKFSEGLMRTVRFNFEQSGVETLYRALEQFVDREMARRESVNFNFTGGRIPIELFIERFRWDPPGRRDTWLEVDGESFSLHPLVREVCDDLSERSNQIAPQFITREYQIRVHPHAPNDWRFLGYRASVQLKPCRGADEEFDLSVASTGIATWVGYTVAEAIRLFEQEAPAASDDRGRPTAYLLDEPERHLHPLAQREVAEWVAARAASGAHVVVATHAPPFLQLPLEDVEYYKVTRDEKRRTRTTRITGEIAEALSTSADELGISAATLIQLTRGWLVVEGEHDRLILNAFFRDELRGAWIQTLALRGAARAKATFLNLQALKPLGIPFFVLLDNVRADQVRGGEIPEGASEEERIAADLVRLSQDESVALAIHGLSYPDVLCMLPPDAVRRAAAQLGANPAGFAGWDELVAAHAPQRESTPPGRKLVDLKQLLLESLRLKGVGIDEFLRRVLEGLAPDDRPHPELQRIVAEVTAAVTAQPAAS